MLPPEKVLPDTQPTYVSSWIYVFGVTTMAALGVVIARGASSRCAAHSGGTPRQSDIFVNSLHLWSVEIFFFAMVIHLWGKYFMAAWRGGRALTWITGRGHVPRLDRHRLHRLSLPDQLRLAVDLHPGQGRHQRHRRRARTWNVLNLGQMLMWHIVLLPLAVVALVAVARVARSHQGSRAALRGARRRCGVERVTKRFRPDVDAPEWKGGHTPYDIVKEGAIALLVVAILTLVLAIVFGSPDEPAITLKSWSNAAPVDFAQDALSQLNGTSETATYGPPYNNASIGQELGPLSLAKWVGVTMPINTAKVFVIDPLKTQPYQPTLSSALKEWSNASSSDPSHSGSTNYTKACGAHEVRRRRHRRARAANAGPVPVFINDLTDMARTGALDAGPHPAGRLLHHELHVAAAVP